MGTGGLGGGGRWRRCVVAAGLAAPLLALPVSPAWGEPDEASARDAAPPVPLDSLLRLPADAPTRTGPRPGGASRAEWEERFRAARAALGAAQERLAEAQAELEELASSSESWQVTAPGAPAGADSGPLSYGLRQEIRRQREEVERARRDLEELRIEANLAGVPEDWSRDAAPPEAATP